MGIKKLVIIAVLLFLIIIALFSYINKEKLIDIIKSKNDDIININYSENNNIEYNQTEIIERLKALGYLE
ncbi:MAG: hypothetical protein AABW92_02225 [Nanoarchaeota archaeon]